MPVRSGEVKGYRNVRAHTGSLATTKSHYLQARRGPCCNGSIDTIPVGACAAQGLCGFCARDRSIFGRAASRRAHLCYEEGDANAARAFLRSWLTTYPRNGLLYSHLSGHLALGDLEAGDAAAAFQLFMETFSPDVHSGPPRGTVNDAVSFLWRWELAGHPRDAEAWRMMQDFANSAFPRAGVAFSDMHIALTQVVAGNDAALEARARQVDELARSGRYPSGPASRRYRTPSPLSNGAISRPRSTRLNRLLANSNASAVAAHSSTWWSSRC